MSHWMRSLNGWLNKELKMIIKEIKEVEYNIDPKHFIQVLTGIPGEPYAHQIKRTKYITHFKEMMKGNIFDMLGCCSYQMVYNGYGHLTHLKTSKGEKAVDKDFLLKLIKLNK